MVTKKLVLTDNYVGDGNIEVTRPALPGAHGPSIDVIVGTATPVGAKRGAGLSRMRIRGWRKMPRGVDLGLIGILHLPAR